MSPKKHFLHVFATFTPAGPQVRAAGLMNALGDDCRHTVVSCSSQTDAADLVDSSIDLNLKKVAPKSGPMGFVRAMAQLLKEQNPDLLLTYNWGSMDAAMAARSTGFSRHVHHEDGFNADEAQALKGRRNWTRRLTLKRAEIVVPSRKLLSIANEIWHLPKSALIPNGVHVERYAPNPGEAATLRAQLGIPENALVVGTMAHLRPVKRLDRLIRACAAIDASKLGGRPLYLLIVGDGEERALLEQLGQQHTPPGGKVLFAGHMSDPAPAYSAMNALALSSASEQQPVSILEAMAASLPIFSTDVGDVRYTVPQESVEMLADPNQPDAKIEKDLAASMEKVLGSDSLQEMLSAASLRQVQQKYSFEAMFSAYQQVFERAMG